MADNTIRVEGNYSAKWISINNALLRKLYKDEIINTYGRGFDVMDLATLASKNGLVGSRTFSFWEKNHWKGTATTSTAIAVGAAKADIAFKIAAGDYDANGNPTLRVGQTVYIPAAYNALSYPVAYRVESRSGSAGDYTFTAKPFEELAEITVEVPIGTKLTLGPIQFAPGTGLPEGTTQSYFQRAFNTTILKTAGGIEGGFLSESYWESIERDGLSGYVNKMLNELEIDLNDQENSYVFMGQAQGNDTMVANSYFGGSNEVLSGMGLWPALSTYGQQLNYTDSFSGSDYTKAKNLLESQGVFDHDIIFAMGSGLMDQLDSVDEDYIREFSSSDLLKNMKEVGFQATVTKRNGIRFNKVKLYSLSNQFSFGNTEYGLTNAGFMMPTNKVKVQAGMDGKKQITLGNLELRYLGKGQENRTRVLTPLNGASGIAGSPAVNEYDGKKYGMLSEPMLVMTHLNQMVQVQKES